MLGLFHDYEIGSISSVALKPMKLPRKESSRKLSAIILSQRFPVRVAMKSGDRDRSANQK